MQALPQALGTNDNADNPQLQSAYRQLLPGKLNSQHQSDKLADEVGK